MLQKRFLALLSVIVALSLAVLACGGGASPTATQSPTNTPRPTATDEPEEEPTDEPEPTEAAEPTEEAEPTDDNTGIVAGAVSISDVNAYVDDYDYVHISGLVYNDTEDAATNIEITLNLVDGNGDTVLKDFDDNPVDEVEFTSLLWTIGPGETSPFDYTVYTDGEDPSDWEYTVQVTDYDDGRVERGDLDIINDQVTVGQYGTIYISGELVNNSDTPILVNSLAGSLFDDDDHVLAGDASYNFTRYLAPAGDAAGYDRTPFTISIDGAVPDASSYVIYWDADQTDYENTAQDLVVDVPNASLYVDDYDDAHVVATVANNGDERLTVQLVAGLYAEDGTVIDAASLYLPIYLSPGDVIPISFDYFNNVNSNTDELDRVSSFSIQFDAYGTYESSFDVVALETANESSENGSNGAVTFSGEVTNDSGESLSSATIILALYDTDDNLMTTTWTSAYPEGDEFAVGDTLPWSLTLYIDSDWDTTGWTFRTFGQGYVN